MIMKIFSDNSGSVSDDIILAGLDDAVKLGADAINMSLGSPAGFTEYGDEDEEETDGYLTYYGVYTRAEAAGVSLMVAAGNETASTNYNPAGNNLTLAQYRTAALWVPPSTLPAAMSVASVDNAGYFRNHFALGMRPSPTMTRWTTPPKRKPTFWRPWKGKPWSMYPFPAWARRRILPAWISPAKLPWWPGVT